MTAPAGGNRTPCSTSSVTDARQLTADDVLRSLVPGVSNAVFGRLRREQIRWAQDLASLERDDLRELGLTMVERSRILRWAKEVNPIRATDQRQSFGSIGSAGADLDAMAAMMLPPPPAISHQLTFRRMHSTELEVDVPDGSVDEFLTRTSTFPFQPQVSELDPGPMLSPFVSPSSPKTTFEEHQLQARLDKIEEQIPFWCQIVADQPQATTSALQQLGEKLKGRGGVVHDVRETLLEDRFDLTPERIKEIYTSIVRDEEGHIDMEDLRSVLVRYGLPGLDNKTVASMMKTVNPEHQGALKLVEFESIVSRLKLAQLLVGSLTGHKATAAVDESVSWEHLSVIDYCTNGPHPLERVRGRDLLKFFFGHRPHLNPREGRLIRWVHMGHFNPTLLLALMVKYCLHPLAVEDVIDQCPTKIERYEGNYFMAVELLCLAPARMTSKDRAPPKVVVVGRHITAFCAGPPQADTIVTIVQADQSFVNDWPNPIDPSAAPPEQSDGSPGPSPRIQVPAAGDDWVEKLRGRISAIRSRVCERKADFLMYQILDLCTDELVAVTRAFSKRLSYIEQVLRREAVQDSHWIFGEVSLSRLQLTVVMRRARGLRRVLRRMLEDPDLGAELLSYLQDVADHLEEAQEDLGHLADKCTMLADAYEHAIERAQALERQRAQELDRQQERIHSIQTERLNKILFVLTVATTIFVPLQFVTGIYGMNFVDPKTGQPTIPELVDIHGYMYFWLACVIYLTIAIAFAVCMFRRMQHQDQEEMEALEEGNGSQHPHPEVRVVTRNCDDSSPSIVRPSSSSAWSLNGRADRLGRSRSLREPLLSQSTQV